MYALIGCLMRVTSFVIYFAPGWGLFNWLRHCQSEQVLFDPIMLKKEKGYLKSHHSYPWNLIYRMNMTDELNPIPPSFTEYTLLSKKETFALFGIILGLQTFVVFLAKLLVSKPFRKLNFLEKVIHAFENTNLADPG